MDTHEASALPDVASIVVRVLLQMHAKKTRVFVIGCSNRIELVDLALLRPGRFDHVLECGIPNEKNRNEILKAILRSVNHNLNAFGDEWAERTAGWTAADLRALVTNAQFDARIPDACHALQELVHTMPFTVQFGGQSLRYRHAVVFTKLDVQSAIKVHVEAFTNQQQGDVPIRNFNMENVFNNTRPMRQPLQGRSGPGEKFTLQ
ncbi:hypothetical protein COOONC_01173 [Cooperia oncophora]